MQREDFSKLYNICKEIRELRKAQHKTQKEVAQAIGITAQSYQAYEAGKTLPTLENFIKLCIYFDVTPNSLLGISEF